MVKTGANRPDHFLERNLTCYHLHLHCSPLQFYLAEGYDLNSEAADRREHAAEAVVAAAGYYSVVAAAVTAVPFSTTQKNNSY